MRKQVNPALIGAFILTAVLLAVAALFFFSSAELFVKRDKCILYFEDSVNGLEVGAPVKFKGVDVGHVVDIMIHYNQLESVDAIPVLVEIDRELFFQGCKEDACSIAEGKIYQHLVERGLRGELVFQSYLTGLLFVELDFIEEAGSPLYIQEKPLYYEIPTLGSGLSEVWQDVRGVLDQVKSVHWQEIGQNVSSLAKNLDLGLANIDFKGINDRFMEALEGVTLLTQKVDKEAGPLLESTHETLFEIRKAFDKIDSIVASVEASIHPESSLRYRLAHAIDEFTGAARAVRSLANYLERNPNALLTGKKLSEL